MISINPIKIIQAKTEEEKERIFSEIWYFLNRANKMVLAYINELNEPVQSIMLYIIDDDMNIYFGTLTRFPKYEFLIKNPPLSIMVQDELNDPNKAVSLKASIVEEISDQNTIKQVLKLFASKNTCKYYIKDQDDFVMFKAKILSARMIDGSSGQLKRYDLTL